MELWLAIVLAVLALLLAAIAVWWLARSRIASARALVRRTAPLPWRTKGRLLIDLTRDGRVPLVARALLPALALYLVLPLDLIPDFIPVLGQLDDLLVIVLIGGLLLRLTPLHLVEEHIERLERLEIKGEATTPPG